MVKKLYFLAILGLLVISIAACKQTEVQNNLNITNNIPTEKISLNNSTTLSLNVGDSKIIELTNGSSSIQVKSLNADAKTAIIILNNKEYEINEGETKLIDNIEVNVTRINTNSAFVGVSVPFTGNKIGVPFNATEYYKNLNPERSGEIGLAGYANIKDPLKGTALNNYFKAQDLTDDYYYVFIQFDVLEGYPTQNQTDILTKDGVALFDWHGDHTFIARAPTDFLLNKNYDFIKWIGLINNSEAKMEWVPARMRVPGQNIGVTVVFYENLTDKTIASQIENMATKIFFNGKPLGQETVNIEIPSNKLEELSKLKSVKQIYPFGLGNGANI